MLSDHNRLITENKKKRLYIISYIVDGHNYLSRNYIICYCFEAIILLSILAETVFFSLDTLDFLLEKYC